MFGVENRTTKDMDTTITGIELLIKILLSSNNKGYLNFNSFGVTLSPVDISISKFTLVLLFMTRLIQLWR